MKINNIVTSSISKAVNISLSSLSKFCGISIGPATTGFKTEWTVSGDATARTITLPLTNNGTFNCTVSWGDGTSDSTITTYNDADRIHTYSVDGTYNVEIQGECPGWSFNNGGDKLKITNIINWGDSSKFGGFSYLTDGFYGCTNLKTMGTNKILAKSNLSSLSSLFRSCTTIASILTGIFDNCTNVITFYGVFDGCSGITGSIPTDLFKYNTAVTTFTSIFNVCSNLSGSIPTDLFRYNTSASAFNNVFNGCSGSNFNGSIPIDFFRYNTSATNFSSAFNGCSYLSGSIPTDLFRYNTSVTSFSSCFRNCGRITSAPTNLFKYNTSVTSFANTFEICYKLEQNANIFYANGEQSTRFLNKTVNFTSCFSRTSFTGTQGTAPDLWNCDFGTGTPTKTSCWSGAGNSTTSLTNYNSIPIAWGGPA